MDGDFDLVSRPAHWRSPAGLSIGALADQPNEVEASDFGLFREVLNSHFYPAAVEPFDPRARMRTPRLSAVRLAFTTIGYVRFGTAARIDPGDLAAYHVNVPLQGSVMSECGDERVVATPSVAAVFSPGRHTVLPRWGADAVQLCIKFDRHAVEQEAADLLRKPGARPIDFRVAFPISVGAGRRWLSILSTMLQFATASMTAADAHVVRSLERSLISGLLVAQQHSRTRELTAEPDERLHRGALDAVIQAFESAPDQSYSLGDLARMSGLSARSVQYAFHDLYGTTPTQYLLRVRLDRARQDLLQGNGNVAAIASYWGFSNLGRFAKAYYEHFAEYPSQTLHPSTNHPATNDPPTNHSSTNHPYRRR